MRRAPIVLFACAILLTCLVCPMIQAVDSWDHEIQTGHDTESALVVVVLSMGAAFVLARAAVSVCEALPTQAIDKIGNFLRASLQAVTLRDAEVPFAPSPPPAVLRI
jgi:hypothetical protein